MGYNFRPVERDQQFLMPPSLRDWLPEDDLAWLVLEAVDQFDLTPFHARYRADGHGAPAYDPAMMTALLLYAYATGERSSRRIEARCRRDVAYRVIAANTVPDHATIARFRAEHEAALGDLFGQVLRLCAAAGLGSLGLVALDGTKVSASASEWANRSADALDAQIGAILAEAAAVDAAEDAALGSARGDELPAGLAQRHSRLARLTEARRQLAEVEAAREQDWQVRLARRAETEVETGHRPSGPPPKADAVRRRYWAERNTTDPDSRKLRGPHGWVQGYNGQAVVAGDGLILAAELTQQSSDATQLVPMLEAAEANIRSAGLRGRIGTLVADAGYWSEANLEAAETGRRTRVLIAPGSGRKHRPQRAPHSGHARMRRRLAHPANRVRYRRRGAIVEPVFGQLKEVRGVRRFQRRGHSACASEWRLLAMTHNLLKLWRRRGAERRAT